MKSTLTIIMSIFLFSCTTTTQIATFTVVSTRNVETSIEYVDIGDFKSGQGRTIDKALDNCFKKHGGELIKNCRVYRRSGILAGIRSLVSGRYKVTGDVYADPSKINNN